MSASRLLILGAVRHLQPVHGYDIRRELTEWHAEDWANVSYGSIYFALGKLAEEGLLEPVKKSQVGNRPARTTYRITGRGEKEFLRLLREFWWEYKPTIDPLQAAWAFVPALPREEILAGLRHRVETGRQSIRLLGTVDAQTGRQPYLDPSTPRHVVESQHLAAAHLEAEVRWAEAVIEKVERGELP